MQNKLIESLRDMLESLIVEMESSLSYLESEVSLNSDAMDTVREAQRMINDHALAFFGESSADLRDKQNEAELTA